MRQQAEGNNVQQDKGSSRSSTANYNIHIPLEGELAGGAAWQNPQFYLARMV